MNGGHSGGRAAALPIPAAQDVHGEYDIIVFGGGSAGCTAAIQAARAGKRTALVEKNGILGGTTTVASVNFPGLFHAWGKQIIRGIGWEIIERTAELGGATLPDFSVVPDRHWRHQILVNRFVYSAVLDRLCLEAGVSLRLHEMPAAVQRGKDGVYVALVGKSGLKWFKASKLVDATGDADVTGLMGYPRCKGEQLQPGTLINDIGGYDPAAIDPAELKRVYEDALRAGEAVRSRFDMYNDLKAGRINMHVQDIDGSESQTRTLAEVKARRQLLDTVTMLRRVPGCERLEVRYAAGECGIRETWRIDGEAVVDENCYVSGYVWPDAVCYSFYPIDLHHHSGYHIEQKVLAPGIVPTLPYRALIPKGSDDLLVAGRCVSGDRMANSAFRVQASCMATGQVAGMAAAIAAGRNCSVRDVPLAELREQLERFGAIVPDVPVVANKRQHSD
ncbi:FAD-dependent oxidoreductase [Paenibacillus ginsengarvi]|uniref:FAD-dependent oxidoreductase n=1 Tax=Paenibacillus ginsengarvi TaxID=400777 RepID=A0A3B0AL71_9BACL|nr:FAD-dependent oxidoreductase [Paenibacillus ginsengarvi]RKN61339.1 FAD-dependent oxidoreductase [Paenibacillus ginsengarvi]